MYREVCKTEGSKNRDSTVIALSYSQPFLSLLNNTTLSPGFLGQWFNNLQWAALLKSLVQYDKILGQQQLVMVNYVCGSNQSETRKYFEWIIIPSNL